MDFNQNIETPWGEIGFLVFKRTYSRRLKEEDPNSKTEEFQQVIKREIEASDSQLKVGFTEEEKQRYFETRVKLKWSVAGRFMWQLGTKTVKRLGLPSLQNCAFTVVNDPIRPFTWAMDMLMLGSGVGYNIQKHNVYQLPKLKGKIKIERQDNASADFIVPDTREGWIKLLGKTLKSHFYSGEGFTYSTQLIRSKGALIKGFGGTSSGPEDLCWGINEIHKILNTRSGKKLRPIDCLDIMNIIGYVVVAGNVRRSAQIAIGDYDDFDYLHAKRWDLGPIPNWRSMSNNSVICDDIEKLPDEYWATYNQGEPYGLINIELARSCGRTGEIQYPDQNIEGSNPCVTGDCEILTVNGYKRIDSLLDHPIKIWNGFEWSEVQPKITGYNQPILTITLSDGRELSCTPYHKWYLAKNYSGNIEEVQAQDLKIGDKIMKYDFPVLKGGKSVDAKYAYTQGFISADGMDDYNHLWLYENKFMCKNRLDVKSLSKSYTTFSGKERLAVFFENKYEYKTFIPFEWDVESRLQWLSGLFDGDGTELKEGGLQLVSVNKSFLLELQKLLSTLGINCKIVNAVDAGYRMLPDGHGGSSAYYCQESYRICIGSIQMQNLKELGLSCERMSFNKDPQRDASQFVKIIKIEDTGIAEKVYCFEEPLRHYGVFNGILTGQCSEQMLEDKETCCLAEVFLPNIEDEEELREVISYAYRMCKHSMALPCHLRETEEIVHKNFRMGIGMTGILQATEEQRSWLKDAYKWLRGLDKWYSGEKGFPESIKLTTVKPSGTLSLLANVTPGVHPSPAGPYYIRRVRIAANSPLIDVCRKHGYPIEYAVGFDNKDDKSTMVISFPCKVPEGTPIESDFTFDQQLDMVRRIQAEWSDNAVSCTVYYKKEDLPDIKDYLRKYYKNEIKTVSFLLSQGHGFVQAPYETISKELYDVLVSQVRIITSVELKEDEMEVSECHNGSCPIK